MMATASGDTEGDDPQVLVFSPSTGALIMNSTLTGLAKSLGAAEKLFDVRKDVARACSDELAGVERGLRQCIRAADFLRKREI